MRLYGALLLSVMLALFAYCHAVTEGHQGHTVGTADSSTEGCDWPRGGKKCCGTLRTPGAAHGWRNDETDHCFPASASDHMVCCVDVKNVDNEINDDDSSVAYHNPLSGPIRRNSHASSYSWCTCSVSICEKQLGGRVAWVGEPGDT